MNIYITFDYELFLSSNTGSVNNCLIKPTEKILEVCDLFNIKTTFFVDTTYLCKVREYKILAHDYYKICQQISNLAQNGHSIQLHIHPQWFYSSYDEKYGWEMDYDHYKLSDCPIEDVHMMFDEGIALIEEVTGNKCNAYRAGGYSIQTLPGYANFLCKKGIEIDSSCLCGKAANSKFHKYDFKKIKNSDIYTFNNDIDLPDKCGNLIELPITTFRINPAKYIMQKITRCKEKCILYGDGRSISGKLSYKQRFRNSIKSLLYPLLIPASIDRQTGLLLPSIYKNLKKNNSKDMTMIIHPKGTTNYSLIFLQEFLYLAIKDGCKFKTTKDLVKSLVKDSSD